MSTARMLFVFVLLTSFLTLLSAPARAQYGAGLQGTVQDKSGAIVANASVTATDNGTGIVHAATTNSSGFYRISELPPGTYTVTAEKSGFKKSANPAVEVQAELLRGLDVILEIGQAQETVNVTETISALKTEDATISGTLTAAEVENLPEIDRDPYELIRLAPGIFGQGANIQLRMTAYNAFNKLNLAPFSFGSNSTIVSYCCGTNPTAQPLFGTATNGLAGRVLELQARLSF